MPLPLQVPLFFNRRQHRFGGAFWCGRADGSLVF
ncbi:peptidase, partial [Neisseria gonorrhoeae]